MPLPTDGPDYWADIAFWNVRNNRVVDYTLEASRQPTRPEIHTQRRSDRKIKRREDRQAIGKTAWFTIIVASLLLNFIVLALIFGR